MPNCTPANCHASTVLCCLACGRLRTIVPTLLCPGPPALTAMAIEGCAILQTMQTMQTVVCLPYLVLPPAGGRCVSKHRPTYVGKQILAGSLLLGGHGAAALLAGGPHINPYSPPLPLRHKINHKSRHHTCLGTSRSAPCAQTTTGATAQVTPHHIFICDRCAVALVRHFSLFLYIYDLAQRMRVSPCGVNSYPVAPLR